MHVAPVRIGMSKLVLAGRGTFKGGTWRTSDGLQQPAKASTARWHSARLRPQSRACFAAQARVR
eukprot:4258373-Alexandrium_andersonii.AAC.1